MAKLNPYLHFDGNAEEAFNFYKSVFGGDFDILMRFKDIPSEVSSPATASERIMHMSLPINGDSILMGSDRPEMYGPAVIGENSSISVTADSEEEARNLFDGLSVGGKVFMPLEKAFWGALFAMFTDKYGVQWMISYNNEQPDNK